MGRDGGNKKKGNVMIHKQRRLDGMRKKNKIQRRRLHPPTDPCLPGELFVSISTLVMLR